tara:strand:+ start:111 stop:668 length:558 start_codon:yes stop_codon:yes gene_type:complete
MACLLDSGYALGCRDNIGGVKRVFIGKVISTERRNNYGISGGEINDTNSAIEYYTFDQEMEAASFSQNGTYSTENGTVFFDQQLTLIFHKNSTALRAKLLDLSQLNLRVIVQDQRDQFWLMGLSNGVRAISGAMNTGKAFGDMNGVTLTLQSKDAEPAFRINTATVATLGATVPSGGAGFNINPA